MNDMATSCARQGRPLTQGESDELDVATDHLDYILVSYDEQGWRPTGFAPQTLILKAIKESQFATATDSNSADRKEELT
jgi:hypothetical protein